MHDSVFGIAHMRADRI